MTRQTVIERIEFYPQTGLTAIRWQKQIVDAGDVIKGEYHRTVVTDHIDLLTGDVTPVSVAQQLALVDAQLVLMKYPATSPDDAVLAHALREFGKTPTADMAKLMDAATQTVVAENKALAADNAVLQAAVDAAEAVPTFEPPKPQ